MADIRNLPLSEITKNATSKHVNVCKRFRKIRMAEQLSQLEFAERLKISTARVKQIERGNFAPNIDIMRALKKQFNISYDYIIDGTK